MNNYSALLPFAILLPFFAMIAHGLVPHKKGGNLHATIASIFQWAYGGFLAALSLIGFFNSPGLIYRGASMPIGVSHLLVEPTLYIDALNAPFLLLLGICLPLVFTWLRDREGKYSPSYYVSANLLSLSLAGVFLSDSLLLFYLFWEAALIGAYFWIGMHGKANIHSGSVYGALTKFFLITLVGSLPMLISIVALCAEAGRDPGIHAIAGLLNSMPEQRVWWVFGGFALAFAVKLPLLGFHGWLRDTYNVSAPACRAVLSGLMSKMGAFGIILILGQAFPDQCHQLAPYLSWLCVAGAVYGALLCLAQDRLVDILIYSSLSHLSLVALGVFASVGMGETETTGLTGAIFQVFNHGLLMTALFVFDARISINGISPSMSQTGGLRSGQGRLAALLLTAIFASASLPGFSNFAGEILVLFAAFSASPWLTFFASIGALITAGALVRGYHRIFLGKPNANSPSGFIQAADFTVGETALALGLILIWLILGFFPYLIIHPVEHALFSFNAAKNALGLP